MEGTKKAQVRRQEAALSLSVPLPEASADSARGGPVLPANTVVLVFQDTGGTYEE